MITTIYKTTVTSKAPVECHGCKHVSVFTRYPGVGPVRSQRLITYHQESLRPLTVLVLGETHYSDYHRKEDNNN